jgi:hypothetical protein
MTDSKKPTIYDVARRAGVRRKIIPLPREETTPSKATRKISASIYEKNGIDSGGTSRRVREFTVVVNAHAVSEIIV